MITIMHRKRGIDIGILLEFHTTCNIPKGTDGAKKSTSVASANSIPQHVRYTLHDFDQIR